MTIVFYRNSSDDNVVDKKLSELFTMTGYLREDASVLNPVISVESGMSILDANYVYINDFNRYYYIVDIGCSVTGIWTISLHVDVLMTYRREIRNQNAIIARQEKAYNLYLEDDQLLTTSKRIYWTKSFPVRMNPAGSGASFILTLAGGAP